MAYSRATVRLFRRVTDRECLTLAVNDNIVCGLVWFWQGDDSGPSPDLRYGQGVQACGVELLEPFLAGFATVLQELWSDVVWPLGFSTLQLANGGGELSS